MAPCLISLLLPLVAQADTSSIASAPLPRIATVDWTIAETLLALGVTPLAVGDAGPYQAWVGEPRLPAGVVDIGLRTQPNRELLAELKPDRILISPLAPTLSRIAPVSTIALYDGQTDLWQRLHEVTLTLARMVGKTAEGERLLAGLDLELASMQARLPADLPPLLVVQFIDERHVRVFGRHSLFDAVMTRLGLRNGWQEQTNDWGFSVVSIEQFMILPTARLVVVDPIPVGVSERLQEPGLWQHLPLVRQAPVLHLPAVWSFGGVLAARRFAGLLSDALLQDAERMEASR
ncbi:ABC transporter substrate-binding protein [Aeromonas veronii]